MIHEEAESFEELAAYGTRDVEWGRPDGAVTLRGAAVSPSCSRCFGQRRTSGGSSPRRKGEKARRTSRC